MNIILYDILLLLHVHGHSFLSCCEFILLHCTSCIFTLALLNASSSSQVIVLYFYATAIYELVVSSCVLTCYKYASCCSTL